MEHVICYGTGCTQWHSWQATAIFTHCFTGSGNIAKMHTQRIGVMAGRHRCISQCLARFG